MRSILTAMLFLSITVTALAKDFSFAGQDFPPFNYQEGAEVKGAVVDVMKKLCEELKHTCTFSILPLVRAWKVLEDGEIHGVLSMLPNPERNLLANFSPTVAVTDVSYMSVKDTAKLKNYKELAGWTVAGIRASTLIKIVQKHNEEVKTMDIKEEVSNEALVLKLTGGIYGKKSAILGSEDVLNHIAKKAAVQIEPILKLEAQEFKIAFSKKKVDEKDLAAFNKALEGLKKSGALKKILEPYSLRMN